MVDFLDDIGSPETEETKKRKKKKAKVDPASLPEINKRLSEENERKLRQVLTTSARVACGAAPRLACVSHG